jgi:hypothetical protein
LLLHKIFLELKARKFSSSGNPNGRCEGNDELNS